MPVLNREATKRLREIIERPGSVIVPGGILPIQAHLAQAAGYEAFHVSGGFYHNWYLALPDTGLWTTTEFVEYARKIVDVVDIPLIADSDVCGGNPVNVYRTVQDLIHAGVAGCHIEDVAYPKGVVRAGQDTGPLGSHVGEELVSVDEQVGRLKAAMDARDALDPNFVIIARTDARGSEGGSVEMAIERARAYEAAGVDMIMFDGMRNWQECKAGLAACRIPAFNSGQGAQVPRDEDGQPLDLPTVEERTAAGEKFILWVGMGWQRAIQTAWEELLMVKNEGFAVMDKWWREEALRPEAERAPAHRSEYVRNVLRMQAEYLPGSPASTPSA
jgi:2-methylisocitrate lyase-like PEP mutase family enzyme